jgi:hypothetical protein
VLERVWAGSIGEECQWGGVLAVAAAPGAGGHAVGRGGVLADALSSGGAPREGCLEVSSEFTPRYPSWSR